MSSYKPKITRIQLPGTKNSTNLECEENTCKEIDDLGCKMQVLLKGSDVSFDQTLLDMSRCSEFQKKVLAIESLTPRGFVTTYGCLARKIGLPRSARAVGNALKNNPFPIVIPCHRTVMSDGSVGGYQGGKKMKRRLIEMEGVDFDLKNRVVLKNFMYDITSN
ncbi:MGMT family protein [candidate division WOR-3 bacterium]|nr:MGMT family protein [candidate division WOR-3 bacterium]